MALKRTMEPFFGKRESRATQMARSAFQRGDTEGADRIFAAIAKSKQKRIDAHQARGERKPIRSAGS